MYIVYYSIYCDYFGVLIGCYVSELHAKLCPIVMYGPRLFIVVLQELHCLPNCFPFLTFFEIAKCIA